MLEPCHIHDCSATKTGVRTRACRSKALPAESSGVPSTIEGRGSFPNRKSIEVLQCRK